MKHSITFTSTVIIIFVLLVPVTSPALGDSVRTPFDAPEFTHHDEKDWINSQPLMLSNFRGKVLLVDFWTFDCWNCYRSFPWLNKMEKRLSDQEFQIIGVHSPEFSHKYGVTGFPETYIIDKKGQVRGIYYGETHESDIQANHIEKTIKSILLENP